MKNKLTYLVAVLLLAVFLAGNILPVIYRVNGNEQWVTMQEPGTENNKGTENLSSIELKEYFPGHSLVHCGQPVFLLNKLQKVRHIISFSQTFYRTVPTPPPNVA